MQLIRFSGSTNDALGWSTTMFCSTPTNFDWHLVGAMEFAVTASAGGSLHLVQSPWKTYNLPVCGSLVVLRGVT